MEMTEMQGILEGLKIIEMGHVVAAPAATAMMADWGADVIKVEPLDGEMARGFVGTRGRLVVMQFEKGEMSWYVEFLNRNKRGLAVDLKQEEGREIIYKLVGESDIFVSNYEMNALERLGMDYSTLSQVNPRLVYGVLTGYGTVGPDKGERGFDFAAAWARSGLQYMIGEPDSPPPPQRGGMMDRVTGSYMVSGLLGAIIHRDRTGEGQEVQFTLYQTGVWTLAEDIQPTLLGQPLPKHERAKAFNPIFSNYRARDGKWLQLAMLQSDLGWPDFCRAIDRLDLEKDPRFIDMDARGENSEELVRIIDEIFATKDRDEWEIKLRANNCIYGRVQSPAEVVNDPQAIQNNFFAEIDHPVAGEIKMVNTPVKFCQNPASIRMPAPEIGQHTEEILLDLNYSWKDIDQLKNLRVIL